MPSGNKIIGHVYTSHMNLEIYISSKIITRGLCGSFDGNQANDIFHRFTNDVDTFRNGRKIDEQIGASWRCV